jgi:hypothetical protein
MCTCTPQSLFPTQQIYHLCCQDRSSLPFLSLDFHQILRNPKWIPYKIKSKSVTLSRYEMLRLEVLSRSKRASWKIGSNWYISKCQLSMLSIP